MRYRIETDLAGECKIPADAYYGINSFRAKENFVVSNVKVHRQMIKSLSVVKRAAAYANMKAGNISVEIADAIMLACDDVLNGRLISQFITDMIQGGAGTAMNMNMNEVIANRAEEILGGNLGEYKIVHPIDHVNFAQSTNDVVPTAAKIASIRMTKKLITELKKLHKTYIDLAHKYAEVIKIGRTHLQDALPISLGQEFSAYASSLERDIERLKSSSEQLTYINIGATAIGTGLNANKTYFETVYTKLSELTKISFKPAPNLVDSTRNLDAFVWLSSAIKILAINLSKTASDLRLLSSGPDGGLNEINLPDYQVGSTMIPNKVNPVAPELINQIAFDVMGNDVTITKAAEAGQLELNVFQPIIFHKIFSNLELLRRGAEIFREKALTGITVNKEKCISYVERSNMVVTALTPHIGYNKMTELIRESLITGQKVKDMIIEKKIMDKEEVSKILNLVRMTKPGIIRESIINKQKK